MTGETPPVPTASPLLAPPALDWRGTTPVDRATGDIYFNAQDGRGETEGVFLAGTGLAQTWAGRRRFTVGETGFGTGLNFLCTWDLWRRTPEARRPGRLHFVSVEGHPLTPGDLARALAAFPDLAPLARQLVRQWPPGEPGFHRRCFDDDRVALTLLFGPAAHMLSQLEARVDAWFLDGFAPAANPAMWDDAVIAELSRVSAPGARLATYTAAGAVRRTLAAHGWSVTKVPGYGAKRDRIDARFERRPGSAYPGRPWCAPPAPRADAGPVAVVGNGVAAMHITRALRAEGVETVMIGAGEPASAVPGGVAVPRLSLGDDAAARLAVRSYLHLTAPIAPDPDAAILSLAPGEGARFDRLMARFAWADDQIRPVDAATASDLLGTRSTAPGYLLPKSPLAAPYMLMPDRPGRVTALDRCGDGWRLTLADGSALDAAHVVLATGSDLALCPTPLPVRLRWGRTVCLADPPMVPRRPVSFGGHAVATPKGLWVGSTFDKTDEAGDATADLLAKMAKALPDLADALAATPAARQWRGARSTTPDHLPLVGPLFAPERVAADYAPLARDASDPRVPPLEPLPGLTLVNGLGARGYQTGPLLGELVAAQLAGAPWPVERHLAEAMHPVRFAIKALVRGQAPVGADP
ncbi:tRNA 5-methylaminomethyl-2-thiouridine biosynthesis bifunctional protein [Rhodothalassium salexigens DSM 2132]|uniref:tRNA 5-methylaminomethyl-2-thiouridine biosynthesis bifunctional protein MnmC n=1 Tax=Rhodothalassium salexigens DSM 2132 TaxID=1188247 RepID=A0A4R2PJ33_RHOSA|nr:tRNA (5-methylaminomethyl-2-thiouridine)(34)-methyltransferase MnmD [Rhodothalassium salexigens]MBK1637750.1 hypothetical protein [Rhodothalassium salexigens DSM 2132]TCP35337.1 tRNA 5-methylaminomethyl-2-thiouridine biosynthesis bifunctional protein [Rhodothalassium salexigens DSM 2132]